MSTPSAEPVGMVELKALLAGLEALESFVPLNLM